MRDSVFSGNAVNSTVGCVFGQACFASARGGALFVDGSANVSVQRTTFTGNKSSAYANPYSSCPTAQAYGSAVYVNSGTVSLTNSILACNTASASTSFCSGPCGTCATVGGISLYVAGGTTTLEGITIARNGSGVAVEFAGGTLQIQDSILYFDNGSNGEIGGTPTVTYSDVQLPSGVLPGDHNINYNPVFAGTGCTANDLRIVAPSLAIDHGNPDPQYNDCIPPSLGTKVNDMGAYGGPGACGWVQ